MVDKKILIGGTVAGAVGIGAVALWFLSSKPAQGGEEIDCSSIDYTQASEGKSVNNRQWKAGLWTPHSKYRGVQIFKQTSNTEGSSYRTSVGSYFVWLGPYTSIYAPGPSVSNDLGDIHGYIDQACPKGYNSPGTLKSHVSNVSLCNWSGNTLNIPHNASAKITGGTTGVTVKYVQTIQQKTQNLGWHGSGWGKSYGWATEKDWRNISVESFVNGVGPNKWFLLSGSDSGMVCDHSEPGVGCTHKKQQRTSLVVTLVKESGAPMTGYGCPSCQDWHGIL